jgi:pteridine reductase
MPPAAAKPSGPFVLNGATALVTGGARRVGAAIVRTLHAAGANVVIHCRRSLDAAQALAAELEGVRAGSTAVVSADLLDTTELPRVIDAALARFGALQVLVNNASSFYATPLGAISVAAWDDLLGTNLRAPLFLAQSAAPELRRRGGVLINIVDIHGLRPLRNYAVYCVAKAGLIMLTRALARELAPEVRVNAVAPGPVLWPEAGLDAAVQSKIVAETPLQHQGSAEDIAGAVRYLCEAPFVTGQVLAVDGGRSIAW